MVRWLVIVAVVIAVAAFLGWFADRYLCDTLPEGTRMCFGVRP
jgi:hypothetical protein